MKGKDTFTLSEIKVLKELAILRIQSPSSVQKNIRQKMRNIGFYGKDDWGIIDLKVSDLDSLIKSGKIVVADENQIQSLSQSIKPQDRKEKERINSNESNLVDLESILKNFESNHFDPQLHTELKVNNSSGNYILCLKKNAKLPNVEIIPIFNKFSGLDVIYTGIASMSLRNRDYRQHFKGNNAGRSTLRKSLGVLFGYKQVPRDKVNSNGKTKFDHQDELKLSEWMYLNLVMFTFPTTDFASTEIHLINHFNPPLNIKGNKNSVNSEFRQLLSSYRNNRKRN